MSGLEKTLLLVVLVNLILFPFFYTIFNLYTYETAVKLLISGRNPFHVIVSDPTLLEVNPASGLPFPILLAIPPYLLSQVFGDYLTFAVSFKYFLVACSIIATFYTYKTLELLGASEKKAASFSLLFALNPLVLSATQLHMTYDIVAIMFTSISLYYFLLYMRNRKTKCVFISSLALGAGVACRIYSLILLPIFLLKTKKRDVPYLALSLLLPLTLSLPFIISDPTSYMNTFLRNFGFFGGVRPHLAIGLENRFFPIMIGVLIATYWGVHLNKYGILTGALLALVAINVGRGFPMSATHLSWMIPIATIVAFKSRSKYLTVFPLVLSIPFLFWALTISGLWWPAGASGISYLMSHLVEPIVIQWQYPVVLSIYPILSASVLVLFILYLVRLLVLEESSGEDL
jgi:hypothetical protein